MTGQPLELDNPFWVFSLAVYNGGSAVRETCLAVQDERGGDVNLLLFCAWCGVARGVALTGVPTMMRMLLADPSLPDGDALAGVRLISMGSSPASERLLADLAKRFPNAEIHLNYGVSEGGPLVFGWYHPDGKPQPLNSVGYPIPGCEWKLEGARPSEGELIVRNPGVAKGYLNRPEATARNFESGWYRTGDILRHDEEGWFYFVARKDDMMVVGGENVFPQEVEATLERHPAVRQAAVVAVPHDVKGEGPVAFVVLEEGHRVSEDELKQFALAHAPAYAHPRRVFFLPNLPLTGTNKIDKPALKAMAGGKPDRSAWEAFA